MVSYIGFLHASFQNCLVSTRIGFEQHLFGIHYWTIGQVHSVLKESSTNFIDKLLSVFSFILVEAKKQFTLTKRI